MSQDKKKNLLMIFCLGLLAFLVLTTFIPLNSAQADISGNSIIKKLTNVATRGGYSSATGEYTLAEILGMAVSILLSFLGVIFICLIIYAGYLWMTARGNEEQIKKATSILKNSVIGLIIVLASYIIMAVVFAVI